MNWLTWCYVYMTCEVCLRILYKNLCNADIHIFLLQISQSNAWTVALQDVQRDLTGFYKCEVSADAPLFHTEIKTGLMIVVGKMVSRTKHLIIILCDMTVGLIFSGTTLRRGRRNFDAFALICLLVCLWYWHDLFPGRRHLDSSTLL